MMMNGHMMTPFGWIFIFILLIFWVLVIVALVFAIRWLAGRGKSGVGPPERTPLDIVKDRYARGEINREEFEKMKNDLE